MKVTYSSNNSGGSWWLRDKDWLALEAAGWTVEWGGLAFCHSTWRAQVPAICQPGQCHGHQRYQTGQEALQAGDTARNLDALAHEASKDCPTMADAVREWERITGEDASDEGCTCCGPPHTFSTDEGGFTSVTGDEIVGLLYPGSPQTLRAAAKRLAGDNEDQP